MTTDTTARRTYYTSEVLEVHGYMLPPPRLFVAYSRFSEEADDAPHLMCVPNPRQHACYMPVVMIARARVAQENREALEGDPAGYTVKARYEFEQFVCVKPWEMKEPIDLDPDDGNSLGHRLFTDLDTPEIDEAWDAKARAWWPDQPCSYTPPEIALDHFVDVIGIKEATWGPCPHCEADRVLVPAESVPGLELPGRMVCEVCRRPVDRNHG
jgi:hypothetical protein